jgi:hypothetical protein
VNKTEKTAKFKTLVKGIERSNEKFAKGKPHERIVMVAKDVLAMLALGRLKAQTGTYVHVELEDTALLESVQEEGCQVSDLLKNPALPPCDVCAIGGVMVAATLRLNKVRFEPGSSDLSDGFSEDEKDTMSARAEDVFPAELLRIMEEAFEEGSFNYERLSSDSGRLRAIYTNLVENKGKCFTHYRGSEVVWPVPESKEADSLNYA